MSSVSGTGGRGKRPTEGGGELTSVAGRFVVTALLGLVIAAGACFASGTGETAGAAAAGTGSAAVVSYVEGQATIDGKPAAIGDTVALGATVSTAAASLCEVKFNTKNVIRLSENTTFVFDPGNLQRGSELRQGAIGLVLRKLVVGADGDSFKVRTGGTVAGVRGTSFFIKAVDPHVTYICCCNGSVSVSDETGTQSRAMRAAHHKAYLFTSSDSSATTIADSTLLYHTDEDMEKAAAEIGETINWNAPDR